MRVRAVLLVIATVICFGTLLTSEFSDAFANVSESPGSELSGMVWKRQGDWHLNGSATALRLGEAMPPGGLVTAGAQATAHSITILLPDGQRMLCECYEAKTCSQGFRIPAITPPPSPAVWTMFVAIRNVLLLRPATAETAFSLPVGRAAMAANFEMVAEVSPAGDISIAPALRVLPAGQYSLAVMVDQQDVAPSTKSSVQPLDWAGGQKAARVRVAGPGVYRIRVSDQTYVPRVEIEVLATLPAFSAAETAGLKQARETVLQWSHLHEGWALHDFLRVYLESRIPNPS